MVRSTQVPSTYKLPKTQLRWSLNGRRFDCGSAEGYIDAIRHVADLRAI